jgi:acyl-CoA thioester hydrolase
MATPDAFVPRASPSLDVPVQWGEMDALGHVNNVVFFRYLESARVAFVRVVASACRAEGMDSTSTREPEGLRSLREVEGVGFILQHAQCRFRRPLFFPDTVRISTRITSIDADRFTLEHDVLSLGTGDVVAIGSGVIVTYDYERGAKVPIPARLRAELDAYRSA